MQTKRNIILNEITSNKLYYEVCEKYCRNNNKHLLEDLYSYFCLIICEKTEEQIEKLYDLYVKNQLKFFLIRIIQNQILSNNSSFYKKFRRNKYIELNTNIINNNNEMDEEIETDETDEINKLKIFLLEYEKKHPSFWFERILFGLRYFENKKLKQICEETKIPILTIRKNIQQVKSIIFRNFKN